MELGMLLPLGLVVLTFAIVAATVLVITGRRRRDREKAELEVEAATALASIPPGNDTATKVARGECRYCSRPAEYRTPVIRHARPWGDAVLRRMGLVPQIKFQLEIPTDLSAHVELCSLHHHRSVTLIGSEIAAAAADQAKFTDAMTRRLISFQATELEAKMESDTVADSKRKRKTAVAGAGSVVSITSAKASNGS